MDGRNSLDSAGMPAPPDVLVVIPVRDRAAIVGDAIRSVLDQTMRSLCLVVVDDGSTDGTADAAIGAFAGDPRAVLIRHAVNRGAAAARNTGAAYIRAPYLAFLDSDDRYDPAFLERTVAMLHADPNCDAVRVGVSVPIPELSGEHLAVLFNSLITNQVMRRYAFDFIGGIPDAPEFRTKYAGEDIAFNQLLHWCFNTKRIDDPLYHHKPGESSAIWAFVNRAAMTEGRLTYVPTPIDEAMAERTMALLQELRSRIRSAIIAQAGLEQR
jgi:glycosyltransferase involved in cell wall biosynthesis